MSAPENLLTAWAQLLFDSLAAAGVRRVIVSPGSRSTPFVLTAAAHPQLTLYDVIDERAAAFFALGQARVTGAPSVVLCTSGSAPAHYLPAVLEADQSGVPLLIVSADRPSELLHVAANQTIDQRLLFEGYARRVVDVGAPDAAPSALRGLRRVAAQAVALTRAPHPGPVHLNVRARKPLEPVAPTTDAARALDASVRALMAAPAPVVDEGRLLPPAQAIDAIAQRCMRAQRGVIVAGPAPASQRQARAAVARLAQATGFALLAEAASQLRFAGADGVEARIDTADWLYRLPLADTDWLPDLVIQLGSPPTSGTWERLLDRHPEIARVVIAPYGWPDPHGSAAAIVHADIDATCDLLAATVSALRTHSAVDDAPAAAFARALAAANARVGAVIDADQKAGGDALSEAAVARTVASALPDGAWFALGNSLPIRTVDAFCSGPLPDLCVLTQRGASGIDGLLSGAAGAASAANDPVVLLVGDVSALHDIGGLALGSAARVPLAIVVVNNGGGRIFEQLPVARVAEHALRHFTTPHACDFAHAARLYGTAFARARTRTELRAALADALARNRCTLIEAIVPPHDATEAQARILAALLQPQAPRPTA